MAKIDKEKFIAFLERQISIADEMLKSPSVLKKRKQGSDFQTWEALTAGFLASHYSHYSEAFEKVRYRSKRVLVNNFDQNLTEDFREGLDSAKKVLERIVEEVKKNGFTGQDSSITDKGGSVANFYNTQIQTQTTNIQIKKVLQDELTPEQFEKLKAILASSDESAKGNKLSEFLKGLGETAMIAILKSVILAQNTGL